MTNDVIISEIRNELNTNSTRITDQYLVDGLNIDDGELVMVALNSAPDHNFKQAEAWTDFVSASGLIDGDIGFNGEYPFPTDLIKPLRAEVSYDGITWVEATVYDIASSPAQSEHNFDQVQGDFSQAQPYIRFERDSYFVRPLTETTIAAGIHIWYEKRQPTMLVADIESDTPSIEVNFHRLYVVRGALRAMRKFRNDYNQNDRSELRNEQMDLEARFSKFMKNRFKRPLVIRGKMENFK